MQSGLANGRHRPRGPVLPFDDDHGYLGGVPAEKLLVDGYAVTLMTSRLPRDGL